MELKERAFQLWTYAMDAGTVGAMGEALEAEAAKGDFSTVAGMALIYFSAVTWPAAMSLFDKYGVSGEEVYEEIHKSLIKLVSDYLRSDVTPEEVSRGG
ncbi:hypothetical protein ACWDSF_03335 [Nocardia beijingensis]